MLEMRIRRHELCVVVQHGQRFCGEHVRWLWLAHIAARMPFELACVNWSALQMQFKSTEYGKSRHCQTVDHDKTCIFDNGSC